MDKVALKQIVDEMEEATIKGATYEERVKILEGKKLIVGTGENEIDFLDICRYLMTKDEEAKNRLPEKFTSDEFIEALIQLFIN